MDLTRRSFLLASASTSMFPAGRSFGTSATAAEKPQRICVVLLDGFGTDYYEHSPMPTLKTWAKRGFFKRIHGVM